MVDVTNKEDVLRVATAVGCIKLRKQTIEAIRKGEIKKGDPLINARYAAINAVKHTSNLIFLAHPIPITNVDVNFEINDEKCEISLEVTVKSIGKTGVELEALNGVMIGLLSIWDMCKYLEKDEKGQYTETEIKEVRVVRKEKFKLE
ncbi:MAG: cyclic pyranopterin monophosphate synthase MoaC [Candidatus Odinarchaeum yellowstonii]|uniref:Cyclic pyranopterin monophosphate synthase MoaC n=1 Tax=Odinarchaeota yellowstonii (strain LCB_4) TaxID=1841599 RepID=A0AAF0IC15_ODILC|nr:MAG: cyclic pyranopterin monophosphate synthase MoaC [Candidatus Odinarchaeum yellowstonii]